MCSLPPSFIPLPKTLRPLRFQSHRIYEALTALHNMVPQTPASLRLATRDGPCESRPKWNVATTALHYWSRYFALLLNQSKSFCWATSLIAFHGVPGLCVPVFYALDLYLQCLRLSYPWTHLLSFSLIPMRYGFPVKEAISGPMLAFL